MGVYALCILYSCFKTHISLRKRQNTHLYFITIPFLTEMPTWVGGGGGNIRSARGRGQRSTETVQGRDSYHDSTFELIYISIFQRRKQGVHHASKDVQ
jgi:hypothetical protein